MTLTSNASAETIDVDTLRDQGDEHFQAKRYAEAESCYKAALRVTQSDAKLWSNLSACCLSLSRPEEALSNAHHCIELDPTWFRGYQLLVSAHNALEQGELALINAVKCSFYQFYVRYKVLQRTPSGFFSFERFSSNSFTIVNNQEDLSRWEKTTKLQEESCYVLVINNCEVEFEINHRFYAALLIVGIGPQAGIRTTREVGLCLSNSKCILSGLRFTTSGVLSISAENESRLFINECEVSHGGPQSLACIVVLQKTSLIMRKTRITRSDQTGVVVTENSTLVMSECEVHNAGIKDEDGAGIDIRNGSVATITACTVDKCKRGIRIHEQPGNVTIADSVVSNSLGVGVMIENELIKGYMNFGTRLFTFCKPVRQNVRLSGNKICSNGSHGVSTTFQANVAMTRNEIAFNKACGLFTDNNTCSKLTHNHIHSNKSDGIQIGFVHTALVIVRHNVIENNEGEQVRVDEEKNAKDPNFSYPEPSRVGFKMFIRLLCYLFFNFVLFLLCLKKRPIIENNTITCNQQVKERTTSIVPKLPTKTTTAIHYKMYLGVALTIMIAILMIFM